MGTVYKAWHRFMDRPVALKIVNPDLVNRPEMAERFRREVQAAGRLSHPNIVAAYDADQAGATHFLILEYVQGVNLEQLLREGVPLPVDRACDLARQTALGLQHAFEQGMVHRDIKPHNLMLTPQGQIKILDFGLARFVSEAVIDSEGKLHPDARSEATTLKGQEAVSAAEAGTAELGLTFHYQMMGTADYIAPEAARDARQADIGADIYSLGCTLYHLLSGRVPFPDRGFEEKMRCHTERTPTPLTQLRPEVPAKLALVVSRMMAKDPADRYQTPAAVGQALVPFASSSRPHVLVVDDDPIFREALKLILEGESGYTVCCASNGEEGLRQLRSLPLPDLILLDLMMPVMGGWQFLHECKRNTSWACIPVLVISAAKAGQVQAIAQGAADYLQKPIQLTELAAEVSRHMRE
jgi:serine/threonine protein kinase